MNFVVLSDGDSNGMCENRSYEAKNIERVSTDYFADTHLIVNKKVIKLKDLSRRCTHSLIEDLQKRYNLTTIGFFVSNDNYDFRGKVAEVNNTEYYDSRQQYDEANKMYRKEKVASYKNTIGYTEFYIVKGQQLKTQKDNHLGKLNEESSKGQIGAAFKKEAKSKKANKVLLTKFGIAVA